MAMGMWCNSLGMRVPIGEPQETGLSPGRASFVSKRGRFRDSVQQGLGTDLTCGQGEVADERMLISRSTSDSLDIKT